MFKDINELEMYLQDKTGATKILLDEIKEKDTQIKQLQDQVKSLSLTILTKESEA